MRQVQIGEGPFRAPARYAGVAQNVNGFGYRRGFLQGQDAPLGREAIRLLLLLRKRGYGEKSRREWAHAVVHLGRVLHEAQGEVTTRVLDETVVE